MRVIHPILKQQMTPSGEGMASTKSQGRLLWRTGLRLTVLLISTLVLSIPSLGKASDGEAANRLFVAGLQAWNQAAALTGHDRATAEQRVALLEQVAENLRRIVDDYTGAELAVRLLIGDQIGPLSLKAAETALEDAGLALTITICQSEPSQACIFAEALLAARDIKDANWREMRLTEIAMGQVRIGFFTGALVTARSIEDVSLRDVALSAIAVLKAEAGSISEALATARELDDRSLREGTLSDITAAQAAAQAKAGFIAEALATARGIEGASSRVRALSHIAAVKTDPDLFAEALITARGIENSSSRAWTLLEIAAAQADRDLFVEALVTAHSIEDTFRRAHALSGIARAQAEVGFFAEALATTRGIEDASSRVRALRDIAIFNANPDVFAEALVTAHSIESSFLRTDAIGRIAVAQAEVGFIADALENINSIDDIHERARGLAEIAASQAKAGFIAEAVATARRGITDASSLSRALSNIAATDTDPNLLAEALVIARNIKDASARAGALSEIGAVKAGPDLFIEALVTVRDSEHPDLHTLALTEVSSDNTAPQTIIDNDDSRPKLELQAQECTVERRWVHIQGQIKNISNENLYSVLAIGTFFNGAGDFIKTVQAMIDYDPILPGQVSNFSASTTTNPAIEKCQVQFRHLSGAAILTTTREVEAERMRERVTEAQRLLNQLGYDAGIIDGIQGSRTLSALNRFQEDRGYRITSEVTDAVLQTLRKVR
jgi:hypothetical protein